jgi:hypothetical protein
MPAYMQGIDGRLDVGQTRRATIQEAARIMGVSEGAIRKRVKRNTLHHDKEPDGRVYVYLDAGVDEGVDEVSHPDRDALISEMESRLAFLENELNIRSEEIRRRDTIIMNMTETLKALSPPVQEEAPQEPPAAPVTATEQPGRVGPQPAVEGPREPVRRRVRSWWKERFGSAMVGMLTAFAVLAANGENPLDPFHTGDEGQQARVPPTSEPAPPPEPEPSPKGSEPVPEPAPEPAPEPIPIDPAPTDPVQSR